MPIADEAKGMKLIIIPHQGSFLTHVTLTPALLLSAPWDAGTYFDILRSDLVG